MAIVGHRVTDLLVYKQIYSVAGFEINIASVWQKSAYIYDFPWGVIWYKLIWHEFKIL